MLLSLAHSRKHLAFAQANVSSTLGYICDGKEGRKKDTCLACFPQNVAFKAEHNSRFVFGFGITGYSQLKEGG